MVLKHYRTLIAATVMLCLCTGLAGAAAAKKGDDGGSLETLKQYVADLKKTPENVELREKTIKYAQSLKQKPPVPEEFERQMAQGSAYLKKAGDAEGYNKAIENLKTAVAQWEHTARGIDLSLGDRRERTLSVSICLCRWHQPSLRDL